MVNIARYSKFSLLSILLALLISFVLTTTGL